MTRTRMAAVDAAWLHMDRPVNELVVNAVLWFDGPLDERAVRDAVVHRLVGQHPRFGHRVDDDGTAAWWVTVPDFDPMAHVHDEHLDGTGELSDLTRYVSRLASTPLPRDRPLWQLHLISGYPAGTVLVARMHHCIADGVALFRVLLDLSDEAAEGRLAPPASPSASLSAVPAGPATLRRRTAEVVHAGVRGTRSVLELVGMPPDRRTTLRGPLGAAKSVRWSAPLPLHEVKAAARAVDATVNDLVLAALSAALHRHLVAAGTVPRDVRAVLPVNLRRLDPRVELGNRFGLVFLRLPVTALDAAARIAAVRRRTGVLKRSATAPVAYGILTVVGRAHHRVVRLIISVFSTKGSLVVTNVPGPREPVHLGGRRLTGLIAWPPQTGSIGVGVSVISYAGRVVLGLMSDDLVVPDPDALLGQLSDELVALGVDAAPELT